MALVFISYRHVDPDQRIARELAGHLTKIGVPHFIDRELRVGQKWTDVIDRELRLCQVLVVLLSADSIRSDMVRLEIKLAHQWRKAILPVRVNYDGALPYDLAAYLDDLQYAFWRIGEPIEPICEAVVAGLEGASAAGDTPADRTPLDHGQLGQLAEVTERRGAPLPYADPRPETGGLTLDSPFYVRRAADRDVETLIRRAGETILVKGPRQVGKTSLAARARAAAEAAGQRTCYIDFQLVDESILLESKTLLRYLAARMAKDYASALKPADVWDDMLGDADSLTDFIERGVLDEAGAGAPVLLCLDEVDNLFKQRYRDGFFGTVRGWHNRRATHPVWQRFNLLIVHSTEPGLFIRDLNQSPFNIGTRVELGDFTIDEIGWLNGRYGNPLATTRDVDRLHDLVGGHPYLVRQSLFALAVVGTSLDALEASATDDSGPFGDHLRRQLWVLRENDRLRAALKRVVTGADCRDEDDFQRLRSAGLIRGESRAKARVRCDLYSRYFKVHL